MHTNPMHGRITGRLAAGALGALLALGLILPGAASAAKKPTKVKVETRNLYLGADLTPAIGAPNAGAAMAAAGGIYRSVLDTNFKGRARLLANEIEDTKPHLIGLQEVALWRRGPADSVTANPTPADEVFVDFLDLLQGELRARGLDYRVAVSQAEADLELPIDLNQPGDGVPEYDGRLTMYDVTLARNVKTRAPKSANYNTTLPIPTSLGTIEVIRGWNAVNVIKGKNNRKQKFRFVNTHLEAFSAFIRNAQASELIGASGAVDTQRPVVLVGDLNSDPDDTSTQVQPPFPDTDNNQAYETVTNVGGFFELGIEENTCCFSPGIRDASPAFDTRIDHILGRGAVSEVSSALIGDDQANRTNTGLWPSDHGGVVAKLKVG